MKHRPSRQGIGAPAFGFSLLQTDSSRYGIAIRIRLGGNIEAPCRGAPLPVQTSNDPH
jgi:hypothetical protein